MFDVGLPQGIYPTVPGYDSFTLIKKTGTGNPTDTRAAGVAVSARLRDANNHEIVKSKVLTTDPLFTITVFDVGDASFVQPDTEDTIVGPDGTKYTVRVILGRTVLQTLHKCLCSEKWDQT
jgi:hypothetical protein